MVGQNFARRRAVAGFNLNTGRMVVRGPAHHDVGVMSSRLIAGQGRRCQPLFLGGEAALRADLNRAATSIPRIPTLKEAHQGARMGLAIPLQQFSFNVEATDAIRWRSIRLKTTRRIGSSCGRPSVRNISSLSQSGDRRHTDHHQSVVALYLRFG
jgi:hypothetical protein